MGDDELQGLARLNAQLEKQLEDCRRVLRNVCEERDRILEDRIELRKVLEKIEGDAADAIRKVMASGRPKQ